MLSDAFQHSSRWSRLSRKDNEKAHLTFEREEMERHCIGHKKPMHSESKCTNVLYICICVHVTCGGELYRVVSNWRTLPYLFICVCMIMWELFLFFFCKLKINHLMRYNLNDYSRARCSHEQPSPHQSRRVPMCQTRLFLEKDFLNEFYCDSDLSWAWDENVIQIIYQESLPSYND